MTRQPLLKELECYLGRHPAEIVTAKRFMDFISGNPDCFSRSLRKGHVTGSAWIMNEKGEFLLIHHRKLNRWLQPGGHADGCPDIRLVAGKEAREETGLESLTLISAEIFDIDIHRIPARKQEPEHDHYDIRYAFAADSTEPLPGSPEINDIAWLNKENAIICCQENASILRMINKSRRVSVQ